MDIIVNANTNTEKVEFLGISLEPLEAYEFARRIEWGAQNCIKDKSSMKGNDSWTDEEKQSLPKEAN